MLTALLLAPGAACAGVVIHVDRGSQTLTVVVDGARYATWPVSTARRGYRTPAGSFRPSRLERVWYSSKYDNAPMPYSIFFAGGYAIHGTNAIGSLGRRVSHGCIRLHPAHARQLFGLVQSYGRGATRIVISWRAAPTQWKNASRSSHIAAVLPAALAPSSSERAPHPRSSIRIVVSI